MWQLNWGEQEEFLESIEATTGEVPQALINKPNRNIWIREYLEAFEILSKGRTRGMTIGNISFSDISTYAKIYGLDNVDEFPKFCFLIQLMDHEFLKYMRELEKSKDLAKENIK